MEDEQLEHLPQNVQGLIEFLGEPEEGELNYTGKERAMSRLDALRELKRLEERGVIDSPKRRGGVNVHIHTSESFSIFRSPAEAAWKGHRAGLEVFGINDHYTISGHREFGEACRILGLRATFSIEAMAMSEEARRRGERYNDPKNPGRTYLCGKGVLHDLEPGSPGERLLKTMRTTLRRRCERMTERANSVLREVDPSLSLTFDDVLRFTPRGNVTERHVAQAIAELINRRFPGEDRKGFLRRLLGSFDDRALSTEGEFQDLIRNGLLKAGGPAYVEEPAEAFPSLDKLVALFREYGAIPTYPVLGNPITEKESDLDPLFDELEGFGIFAVEVVPGRNTEERLREILKAAERHGFPVFSGTEHNTKSPQPILDAFSRDPRFLPTFRRGAHLILGHQFLSKYARRGYIDQEGRLTFANRRLGTSFFSFVGGITWPGDALEWLTSIGEEDAFKLALGLYAVLDDRPCRWAVKPGFKVPNRLLKAIKVTNAHVLFRDEGARSEFERLAKSLLEV